MNIPTQGESFARLIEYLRKAQEQAAMLAHLHNTESSDKDKLVAKLWLVVEDQLKKMVHGVMRIASGKLQ